MFGTKDLCSFRRVYLCMSILALSSFDTACEGEGGESLETKWSSFSLDSSSADQNLPRGAANSGGIESAINVVPFVDDMTSGIGDTTIFLTLRLFQVSHTPAYWGELVKGVVALKRLSDSSVVPSEVELGPVKETGLTYEVSVVVRPDSKLDSTEWYELEIATIPNEMIGAYVADPRTSTPNGGWHARFKLGHDSLLKSITTTSESMSIRFSEEFRSFDYEPSLDVRQNETDENLCKSMVPAEHWRDVGSSRLDARCTNVDIERPLHISLGGRVFTSDDSTSATDISRLSTTVFDSQWKPCGRSSGTCWIFVP